METKHVYLMHGWMDELGFYVPFNSISVISRRWKGEHERLCAMKRRLGPGRIRAFDKSHHIIRTQRYRFV